MKAQQKKAEKMKHLNVEDNYEHYRPFPLYIILICGLFIFCFGAYLVASNAILKGTTLPNSRFGRGGGNTVFVNAYGLIIIGVAISIFPTFQLIKRGIRKRNSHNNN